jgi:hypothetical protein
LIIFHVELGYGNNAVEMETTATWDAKTKEFIIHTPTPLAQKYWITNSAVHAKWAGICYISTNNLYFHNCTGS